MGWLDGCAWLPEWLVYVGLVSIVGYLGWALLVMGYQILGPHGENLPLPHKNLGPQTQDHGEKTAPAPAPIGSKTHGDPPHCHP